MFDWSGVPTAHIRPTFFAQWLTYPLSRKHILERGVISQPLGNGRHAPIAAEDQARFIAAVLADPAPHKGKVYPPFGPCRDRSGRYPPAVGEVIGRPVGYEPISSRPTANVSTSAGVMPPCMISAPLRGGAGLSGRHFCRDRRHHWSPDRQTTDDGPGIRGRSHRSLPARNHRALRERRPTGCLPFR